MKIILKFFLALLFSFSSYANQDSLWSAYHNKHQTDSVAVSILKNYAEQNLSNQRDSAFLIFKIQKNLSLERLNFLYRSYFSSWQAGNKNFVLKQANEWARLNEAGKNYTEIYLAYHNLGEVLNFYKENASACAIAEKEYHFAHLANNKKFVTQALFSKGKCFEVKGNKNEAFKSYLDAYYFSLELNDKLLIENSLSNISGFFAKNELYTKAAKYKLQQLDFYTNNTKPIDSVHYFTLLYELSDHLYDNDQIKEAKVYSDKVFSYSIRHNNRSLLLSQLSIVGSNFSENNNFNGLIELYTIYFPSELDSLRQNNPVPYYRIRSLIHEQKGQTALAIAYLDSAHQLLNAAEFVPLKVSIFNIRKAEFFLRHNMPKEAITCLQRAHEITIPKAYYPFLKLIAQDLDTAYAQTGNYKSAHYYRGLTLAYADSLRQMLDNDAIVLLELENVEKQKELMQIQHEALVNRKHNLQYMLIVILIATSFIVLIVFSSVKIPDIVIRGLGYFVFIFFFEFIILLADNKIHHMTHGEPLKIMGLKIILIGALLPLHHWVEHKVVHYLLHHHILEHFRMDVWFKTKILRIRPKPVVAVVEDNTNEHNPNAPYNEPE